VSPDITKRYECDPRPLASESSYEDAIAAVFPDRCAINYIYYSLSVDGGDRGVAAAQDEFVRRGAELNARLPVALKDRGVGYTLIPTTTAKDRARVQRATEPTVAALAVLGLAAGVVTAMVASVVVSRELRRAADDQLQWWRLGLTAGERTRVVATPMLLAVATGLAVALAVAWWLSPLGPVGNVRAIEPSPSRTLTPWSWWGGLALATVLTAAVAALTFAVSRRAGRPGLQHQEASVVGRLVWGSAPPEVGEGVRAAFDWGRGAGLVVASGALAVAAFLTTLVFGGSLSTLISTPRAYGWPWDIAAIGNFGYGPIELTAVERSLNRRDDVERWSALAFTNDVAVNNEPVVSMIGLGRGADLDFALAEGRLPDAEDEVALGVKTAADHDVGVGDVVELRGGSIAERRATVTGLTVLPALGPFESDRASPGDGMVLPASMFPSDEIARLAAFVGIDLADGADEGGMLAALRPEYEAWGLGIYSAEYQNPVRPAEIVDTEGVRSIPLLVGALLGTSVVVGLALVVVASVRARRRELAVLRALGFTGRQVRTSVRIQTVASMLAALVIGVPLGVVIGRVVWRSFASSLAVVQPPSVPAWAILLTMAGALIAALVAAAIPATIAGRARPAVVLRSE
jgi:hypothetical protein